MNEGEFFASSQEVIQPTTEAVKDSILPEPADFLTTAKRHHILILAGTVEIDKRGLAREVVGQLQQENSHLQVVEWLGGLQEEIEFSLQKSLASSDTPTIFLFLNPPHRLFMGDLADVERLCQTYGHFVVVTTTLTLLDIAQNQSGPIPFWVDLSPEMLPTIYSDTLLIETLLERLAAERESLPLQVLTDRFKPEQILSSLPDMLIQSLEEAENGASDEWSKPPVGEKDTLLGKSIPSIAHELGSPLAIDSFVRLLSLQAESVTPKNIADLIQKARDIQCTVQYLHTHLPNREDQLLTLGLSFFEGLSESQALMGLEQIIRNAWKQSLSSVGILDYYHLDGLENLVVLDLQTQSDENNENNKNSKNRVEGRFPNQRQTLIQLTSKSHKRHLLAALPALAQLAKDSASDKNRAFGGPAHRDQLRGAISQTIGGMEVISQTDVENTLLQLATAPEKDAQMVAVSILIRWVMAGRQEDAFSLLQRWQTEHWQAPAADSPASDSPDANIQMTVARTVNYMLDINNQALRSPLTPTLPPALDRFVHKLSESQQAYPDVYSFFYDQIVPKLIPHHLIQCRELLFTLAQDTDVREDLVNRLVAACPQYQPEIERTLDEWHQQWGLRDDAPTDAPAISWTPVMIMIARTYNRIGRFQKIEDDLYDFVIETALTDRVRVVNMMVDIYLHQRKQQEVEDTTASVDGIEYPTWESAPRPLTTIEKLMQGWLAERVDPVAHEVALQSLIESARLLDIEADRYLNKGGRKLDVDYTKTSVFKPRPRGFYISKFAPWLATFFTWRYRSVTRHLLPIALTARRTTPDFIDFVLLKWRKDSDRSIRRVGRNLRRALRLVNNGNPLPVISHIRPLFKLLTAFFDKWVWQPVFLRLLSIFFGKPAK